MCLFSFLITFPLLLSFVSLHHFLLSSLCLLYLSFPCTPSTFSSRWSDSALLNSLNRAFLTEAITRFLMKRGRLPDTPPPSPTTQICILVLIKPTVSGFNEWTSVIFKPSPNEFADLSQSHPDYSWKEIETFYSADNLAEETLSWSPSTQALRHQVKLKLVQSKCCSASRAGTIKH